ncbi:MAG: hypothetical protein ABIP89_15470, partial [Polyangiaceae bacterium]
PLIGRLTITAAAESGSLQITCDGERLPREAWGHPRAVDPGAHAITAAEPGKKTYEATLQVAGGGAESLAIPALEAILVVAPVPEPPPPATPEPEHDKGLTGRRKLAILVGGVGVVGLGVGSIFGLVSINAHKSATNACATPSPCGSVEGAKDWTSATQAGNISTVAFIVGGAALATGVVLWVLPAASPDRKNASVHITPIVGPGSAGLAGAW